MTDQQETEGSAIEVADEGSSPRHGVQVISRAAKILRSLENEPNGLGLGTIAKRIGLARSTVQRIVGALLEERLLEPASASGGVRLGSALVRLAVSASIDITQMVRPHLVSLSRECKETVDLSALRGSSVIFLDQVVGSHRLRTVSAIGELFPLHASANGKALLATMDDDQVLQLLGEGLPSFTPNTITDREELLEEINHIRRCNYAIDREEHAEGVIAIGVAIEDPRGKPFAISIPVPTTRFAAIESTLVRKLLKLKEEISHALPS